MFIRLSKLTGKATDRDYYINPDHITDYGPKEPDKNLTIIYFTDNRKAFVKKSPREVSEILTDCGVEVWR